MILFISHDSSQSGAPLFLLRFLRWYRANDSRRFCVLTGHDGPLRRDFSQLGRVDLFEPHTILYRVLRKMNAHKLLLTRHRRKLLRELQRRDIELIYANSIASGPMIEFASALGCPLICHVHELESAIQIIGQPSVESVRRANVIVTASSAVKDNLVTSHKIPAGKIEVVNTFIPTDIPDEARRERVFGSLALPWESFLVCGSGTLIDNRKGADRFIEVASAVASVADRPVYFLWLGGPDRTASELEAKLGNKRIKFLGHVSDVHRYLAVTDVFLMTSREEPMPMVMLEAALYAKPSVCFHNSGGPPLFIKDDAGFCVSDAPSMCQALEMLLSDDVLRSQKGQAARERLLTEYSIDHGAKSIARLIDSISNTRNL